VLGRSGLQAVAWWCRWWLRTVGIEAHGREGLLSRGEEAVPPNYDGRGTIGPTSSAAARRARV